MTTAPLPKYDPSFLDRLEPTHPYLLEERRIRPENLIECRVRYDPKANRIVLPHFWKGDLVGWQTRQLADDGGPKYKNTPEFPKSETIYRLPDDLTKTPIVVESVMSVVSKVHIYPWICATFGATVSDRQCQMLSAFPRVVLWFDNDPAGWKATERVASYLARYTDVLIVDNPWDADAGDLNEAEFCRLAASPVPWVTWQRPRNLKEWRYGVA